MNYEIGKIVTDHFAVKKSYVGIARNDKQYLDLLLTDGKTDLRAKMWDFTGEAPKENTVVEVQALVNLYQSELQLVIQQISQAKAREFEPSKFIPVCKVDKYTLIDEFVLLSDIVKDTNYSNLLKHVVNSYIFDMFTMAPGAKSIHHAYLHGLLEHSVNVTKKAVAMADKSVDIDLLIAGALLHDIGKIDAYDWSGCVITTANAGWLIGHIPMGILIISDFCQSGILTADQKLQLLHLIASHHGKLEYGSPVEPQTKEAIILHTADMLDYQCSSVDRAIAEAVPGSEWTAKAAGIGREFYVGGVGE